jgi:CRISPR-associated protein Cas2
MRVILAYDITDDKARLKVAEACLDYGLDRIQMSTFAGRLTRNMREELFLLIRKLTHNKGGATVTIMPICEKDWDARLEFCFDAEA